MSFMVVSMATLNTPYENEAKIMSESADKFKLDNIVYAIPDLGDWTKNCAQNAEVILEAMEYYPEHDILFVDADATFEREPILFNDYPFDFAISLMQYPGEKYPRHNTGTIWAKNNDKVKKFIREWQKLNEIDQCDSEYGEAWEQANLRKILEGADINFGILPDSYCWIFDNEIQARNKTEEPVIVHHQASRRFKALINGRKK